LKANRPFRITFLLITVLMLCACQAQPNAVAAGKNLPVAAQPLADCPLKSIKIGYIPVGALAPIFVAYEKGYFAEQGLEVTLESFRTGGEMIAPLSLGQLDVGSGEPGTALFNAIAQGLDVRVTLPNGLLAEGHNYATVAIRKALIDDGTVAAVADLKGMRLAVNNLRGMTEYYANEYLGSGGLTIDDVELVVLPFPEMLQALENGAVDAAYLQHPLAAAALNPGPNGEPPVAVELFSFTEVIESQQMGVMFYGKNLLKAENEEAANRVTVALIKALRDLQGDAWQSDAAVVAAISKYTGQSKDVIRQSIISYFEPNGVLDGTSLLDMQSYYLERGYTEYSTPLPLEDIIVTDFQEEAIERLGRFE